jgi:hypothetical protein
MNERVLLLLCCFTRVVARVVVIVQRDVLWLSWHIKDMNEAGTRAPCVSSRHRLCILNKSTETFHAGWMSWIWAKGHLNHSIDRDETCWLTIYLS